MLYEIQALTNIQTLRLYFDQSIKNGNCLECFACIAAAVNLKSLDPDRIVTFLVNAIEDVLGSLKDSKFIDNVLHIAKMYVGPNGPYLLKELNDARIQKRGHGYVFLRRAARKKWSFVLGLCLARSLWKNWIKFRLRPEGPFIKRKAKYWRLID
jgi:hypothetical protein